jgi:hypothetical protein
MRASHMTTSGGSAEVEGVALQTSKREALKRAIERHACNMNKKARRAAGAPREGNWPMLRPPIRLWL